VICVTAFGKYAGYDWREIKKRQFEFNRHSCMQGGNKEGTMGHKIREIVERLATDPAFRSRVEQNAERALREFGYHLSPEEVTALREEAMGEALEARASKTCLATLVPFQLSMAAIPRDRVATASQEAGPVTTVVVNVAGRPYSGKQVGTALVGGMAYAGEERVSDTITSSAGETDGEPEYEDPESPRMA
jgi:hypothetical protein